MLFFMNVLEGFAPATVAAPGEISLKNVSAWGYRIPGVRFLEDYVIH